MWTAAEILLAFVAFYPVCTAALWIAGGVIFRFTDEHTEIVEPEGGWPGVTVLIPAYNEAAVIAMCVHAARRADYPELEILVLDDGSVDGTAEAARAATEGDPRCRVIRDEVNRGKADRLNIGFREARHELVVVTDADTHIHPLALKFLVSRINVSPIVAAVAGSPHVTNRGKLLQAMQVLERASIIGLLRRTQGLTGRVAVVAGVLGLFRRDRVLAVGGYDPLMATEDIDLSWKLLLHGWQTAYEPNAIVGMQVPSTMRALWAQRKRWARGQGETLRKHFRDVIRVHNHRMWLVGAESLASLVWVCALAATLIIVALALTFGGAETLFGFAFAWGVAVAVVATVQLTVALLLERRHDPTSWRAMLIGAVYPVAYWLVAGLAALHSQTVALVKGPRKQRVVWDVPRERIDAPEG